MLAIVPQLVANGLIQGILIAVLALGFALPYAIRDNFNLVHLFLWVVNGYLLWLAMLALPTPLGILGVLFFGIVLSALMGAALVTGIYLPLQRRGTTDIFIPSLALLIIGQSIFAIAFGPTPKLFNLGDAFGRTTAVVLGSVYIEPYQLLFLALSLPMLALCIVWLKLSKQGKLIAALVQNRDLAVIVGIDTRALTIIGYMIGSALLPPAAIAMSGSSGVGPYVGLGEFILAIAAALAAPVGNFLTVIFLALALGLFREVSLLWIPGQWQTTFALVAVMIMITIPRRSRTT